MANDSPHSRLSAGASLSFLLTGVASLSSCRGCVLDKGNHTTPSNNDGDEDNDEDDFPHPTQSRCESKSNSPFRSSSSSPSRSHSSSSSSGSRSSGRRRRRKSNASDLSAAEDGNDNDNGDDNGDDNDNDNGDGDGDGPAPSSVLLLHARDGHRPPAPVRIVDDVVPCGLVPLLPRTHGPFGLVAQTVPCARWPAPGRGPPPPLQSAARAAAQRHEAERRGARRAAAAEGSGALVEWTSGAVGFTADTAGLGAEQRIVAARYYALTPKDPTRGAPVRRAGTLQSVVREQMSRMFCAGKKDAGENELQPRFARVVEMSYASVESLDRAVKGHAHAAAFCDALLNEAISFGVAPRGEPHKLALFHASLAHRVLLESQMERSRRHNTIRTTVKLEGEDNEEEDENEDGVGKNVIQGDVSDEMSVTETLFELILIALRDVLHRRIGVQYELLRILRVKALAATHQNQIGQYTCWLATVPSPVAVLYALAGSTLFGALAARRWPASGRAQSEREKKRAHEEAPDGMATRRRMRLRVRETDTREERVAPTEADLLEESYMTRFVAQMRRPGPPGNTAVCDEVALAETVRWFRKYRRTMTLRELDAFARRRP